MIDLSEQLVDCRSCESPTFETLDNLEAVGNCADFRLKHKNLLHLTLHGMNDREDPEHRHPHTLIKKLLDLKFLQTIITICKCEFDSL